MQNYDQNTDWKQLLIQEFNLRQQAEQNVSTVTRELHSALAEHKKALDYNKYLELKCDEFKAYAVQQDAKMHGTIQMLKTAKQLIQQRKHDLENLQQTNQQLTEQLVNKNELLSAEVMRHEQTGLRLNVAIEDIKEANEINRTLKIEKDNLAQELLCRSELLDAEIMQHSETSVALNIASTPAGPTSKIELLDEEIMGSETQQQTEVDTAEAEDFIAERASDNA